MGKERGKCKDLKVVKAGDKITMSSRVSLLSSNVNGNIVPGATIDTSTDTIKVGDGLVIAGWDAGMLGPSQAWGERGLPGSVPANATVVIDVKIDTVERELVFHFLNQISSGTFRRGG